MQLFQKRKTFSRYFSSVLKSRLIFQHFQKKLTVIANVFPKLWTRKEALKQVSKKCAFTVTTEKQDGKDHQTHFKLPRWHLYQTY